MNKPKSSKISVIVFIVIVIIGIFIYFYTLGNPSDSGISSLDQTGQSNGATADSQLVGAKVLVLLNQINSLKIDNSIFNSITYKTLVDNTIAIPEQNVGRFNPFEPVGYTKPVVTTKTPAKTTVKGH